MINDIRSKYILIKIIKEHLPLKKYFYLIRYNKKLQEQLEISIENYKELYRKIYYRIEMELTPISQLDINKEYNFINIRENKDYYHIYFNEDKKEIKRRFLRKEDNVNKIMIKLDTEIQSLKGLFNNCTVLKEIKCTKFNRNDFLDMSDMFYNCSSLSKLDITKFKTPFIKDMSWMFALCSSLTELDIKNFDTSNVITMSFLFSGCYKLQNINYNFNTKKVEHMRCMFNKCYSLRKIDISKFDFTLVKNEELDHMFYECVSLKDINIEKLYLPGDIIETKVIEVDEEKKQVKLSIKVLNGKNKKKRSIEEKGEGFKPLKENLDMWVQEKLKDLKK